MTSNNHRPLSPFSIQLAVDGSENSVDAALLVRSLPLPPGSRVAVVGVLTSGRSLHEVTLRVGLEKIQEIISEGGIEATSYLLDGHIAKALIEFADEHQPDLIVVGATGLHTTLKILLGGIAQQVVEYARWPVLVVRAPFNGIQRVLLAVDGSPYSRLSAEYLTEFPLPMQTEVSVMHVLPPLPDVRQLMSYMGYSAYPNSAFPIPAELQVDERQKEMEEREGQAILREVRQILEPSDIKTKGILVRGDPANEILKHVLAEKIDLVVAGSRGLSAIKGWWWGSVSRKLVHYADCSVLFVRGRPEKTEEKETEVWGKLYGGSDVSKDFSAIGRI